jgi:hypothetical protein
VLHIVRSYIRKKVDFLGLDPRELGLQRYVQRIKGRLLDAIRPDDTHGEPPLLPILNRYAPTGSTADVDFKTTRICHSTAHSHINQMPMHTQTWESSAAFYLEMAANQGVVRSYARNDGLQFTIPYEYYGISHSYEPDFLVKLMVDAADPAKDVTVIIEIKGYETDQDLAKHQAARRWVRAVNNWGKMSTWDFHVSRDPQLLLRELSYIRRRWQQKATAAVPTVEETDNVTEAPIQEESPPPPLRVELPEEWLASIQVAPESKPFLLRCYQANLPLPEVGYETRDRRRNQAELAWETLNVAVFLPNFAVDKPVFEDEGWQTYMLDEEDLAFQALLDQKEKVHA